MDTATIQVEIHPKFLPLLNTPHTFASIVGGRGGMKSEQTHKVALLDAINRPLRTCCARETMSSIKDSSHKLLQDCIQMYGMARSQNGPYEIQSDRILRKEGDRVVSEFIFVGIRENVRDQKSLKGINRTILEEAAKVSADSWEVFPPTVLREEGAQLWAIWNPELSSDPTWDYFVNKTPPNCIKIETNYLENPWLSETMRALAEHCQLTSPDDYPHIWMGLPRSAVVGSIYGEQMKAADGAGRVCHVPYNRMRKVHTFWDLGYGDKMAIWFAQVYDGWFHFIDYIEDHGKTIHHYVTELQERTNKLGYVYDAYWVPHDALDIAMHKKLTGDHSKSIESVLRGLVGNVRLVAKAPVADGINAVRMFLPDCRFDMERCRGGLTALRTYQWGPLDKNGMTKREPLHNEASHGADAFRYAAYVLKHEMPDRPSAPQKPLEIPGGVHAWMAG